MATFLRRSKSDLMQPNKGTGLVGEGSHFPAPPDPIRRSGKDGGARANQVYLDGDKDIDK